LNHFNLKQLNEHKNVYANFGNVHSNKYELWMMTKPGQTQRSQKNKKQLFPTHKCVTSWFNIE